MVTRGDASGGGSVATASSPFLFGSSSAPFDTASSTSPSTTTHFFNVLSGNAGGELTTVQHYNDIARPKNTNMDSKNLNPEATSTTLLVLSKDCSKNRWDSFRDRSSSFMESTRIKITNKNRAMDKNTNNESMVNSKSLTDIDIDVSTIPTEKSPNTSTPTINYEPTKPLNIKGHVLQRDQTVIRVDKPEEKTFAAMNRGTSLKEKFFGARDRLSVKEKGKEKVGRTRSLRPLSLKRNLFFSSINKSTDPSTSRTTGGIDKNSKVRLTFRHLFTKFPK